MVEQQATQSEKTKAPIRITCSATNAREIVLTGSFNDWDAAALPMAKSADGEWKVDLRLSPGRYEYKFVVDGVSCCDPHLKNGDLDCEACAPHKCGALNRILLVR